MPSVLSKIQQKHGEFMAAKVEGCCMACGKLRKDAEEDLKQCAGCKKAAYCNRDCQKEHWKDHKKTCTTVSTETDSETTILLENIHEDWKIFQDLHSLSFGFLTDDFLRRAGKSKEPEMHYTIMLAEYDAANPNKAARFPVFDGFVCTKNEAEHFLCEEFEPAEIPDDDELEDDLEETLEKLEITSDSELDDEADDGDVIGIADDDDPLLYAVDGDEIAITMRMEFYFCKKINLEYIPLLYVIIYPDGSMNVKPFVAKHGKVNLLEGIVGKNNLDRGKKWIDSKTDFGGVKMARDANV